MTVPKKVAERISGSLKKFQDVLQQQKDRDVSEADTVTIVKDLLCEVFGYDKFAELTSEHAIKGTYCDIAVKIESKLAFLIEVKAIGRELKESHIKQGVDYAANQGCDWVVLTNGVQWRLYQVVFKKPIDKREISRFDLLTVNRKSEADLSKLYLLTREGFTKSALKEYIDRKDATSRFVLAAIILHSPPVKSAIRSAVHRVSEILVEPEAIDRMLREEVIKRESIEGEDADKAAKWVLKNALKGNDKDDAAAGGAADAGASSATTPPDPAATPSRQ